MLLLLSSRRLRLQQRSFPLMIEQPATQADKRALIQRGKIEERRQDETISIDSPKSKMGFDAGRDVSI